MTGGVLRRSQASQQEKYVAFKTAYSTVSHYKSDKNFIAAYVVAFSLIEDRLHAMYVLWHQKTKGELPKNIDRIGFVKIVRQLKAIGDIPAPESELLIAEAHERNQMLHAAMWNLDTFKNESVMCVISLSRMLEKLRRNSIKKYK